MTEKLRISGVVKESIVDGKGLRFVVFCQGCPHGCPGCHNPQTHDFSGGYEIAVDKIAKEIEKNPLLQGVTFSGGEPFCQPAAFAALGERIREMQGWKLDIMVSSGFTYEELMDMAEQDGDIERMLMVCDYLIDGKFVMAERDLTLKYRGSRNQRYIDLRRSRMSGKVMLAAETEVTARRRYAAF